jgi:hypothetical protein
MTSYLRMATVQEEAVCVVRCFETRSVIKSQHRYRTQYGENMHLHIMLSYVGYSSFKRLVVFCTENEREMLKNNWKEIEYCLDILLGMKGAHVEVV